MIRYIRNNLIFTRRKVSAYINTYTIKLPSRKVCFSTTFTYPLTDTKDETRVKVRLKLTLGISLAPNN